MKMDTITLIISGALLIGALITLYAGRLLRRRRLERELIRELLKSYFRGDVSAGQLGRRAREIVGHHFTRSDEFYALVVSAFQRAVDASLTRPTHAEQSERRLLVAMAALKNEFGLPDRYQVEAWRPWRE